MTNYERIKGMTLEEMVMFLDKICAFSLFSEMYCGKICPNKKDGRCIYEDENDDTKLPCYGMTPQDDIQAWLEHSAEESE